MSNNTCTFHPQVIKTPLTPSTAEFSWWKMLAEIRIWVQRHNQRRALAKLNDEHLDDIGISRVQLEKELSKRFWEE